MVPREREKGTLRAPGGTVPEALCTLAASGPGPWSGHRERILVYALGVPLSMIWGGCTSFDASDKDDTRSVLLGKKFTISLPASEGQSVPRIANEAIARFLGCKPDPSSGLIVYEFQTAGVGETEIHIPKQSAPGLPDFVMTVKVVLGGTPFY